MSPFSVSGQAIVGSNFGPGVDELDATHRGCHKFIPRHTDELFIEIGDPIYVEVEADDLWCDGKFTNLDIEPAQIWLLNLR